VNRKAWALAAVIAVAAVAADPRAPGADAKRVLGLLVAVVALAVGLSASASGRSPRAVLALLAFVAWSGLTLAWGVPAGVGDLGTWVAAAGLALALGRGSPEGARRLAERAALLAGSAAAAIAVGQRLSGARGLFVHGGQGNANWLGLLLALTLPLTVGLARAGRRAGAPAVLVAAGAGVALQATGLVLSHSRVAWAASSVALAALAVSWLRRSRPTGHKALAVAAVVIGAVVTVTLATRSFQARAPAAAAEGADVPVPIAWEGRVWIWRSSAAAALASLPAGAGLGGFAHAYLDAQGARLAELDVKIASRRFLNATTAHGDWLEVLVDSGPPALALLALAIFGGALAAAREGWREGAAALIAFAVCAVGDSPLRQPAIALLLGLVLAGCSDPAPARPAPSSRRDTLVRASLLVAAALVLAPALSRWIAARRLTAAKEAAPTERSALLTSAARIDPRNGEIALEQGLLELEGGDAAAALGYLQRSRPLLANVGTDIALGNAETELGHPEAALAAYEAALRRHPGSLRAHANVTQPLLGLGRIDEAERHLTIAAALWPGNGRVAEIAEQIRQAKIDRATAP